jgi:hypothetical protein
MKNMVGSKQYEDFVVKRKVGLPVLAQDHSIKCLFALFKKVNGGIPLKIKYLCT